MAKNKSSMTVVSGKTLSNLIDLQMATQGSLQKINAAMQDANDKKGSDSQQALLDLTKKLLDVTLDNFKLNQKSLSKMKDFDDMKVTMKGVKDVLKDVRDSSGQTSDTLNDISKNTKDVKDGVKAQKKSLEDQNKIFDDLTKNMKNWKTVGDKLKDLKTNLGDKFNPESIQKKMLKGLNIGGLLNEKILAVDFKKQAKLTGQAAGLSKKDLDKQAKDFAAAMMASQRENAKLQSLAKRTGRSEEDLQSTPVGKQIIDKRNAAAAKADALLNPGKQDNNQKSSKDASNKMGGNTNQGPSKKDASNKMGGNTGISVPLADAENNPLTSTPTIAGKEDAMENQRVLANNADNLQRIADNTDTLAGRDPTQTKDDKKSNTGGGKGIFSTLLDSVLGMFSDSFFSAIRSVFSVKGLLKVIGKVFAPAMLIGSLVNGIMDGFTAWKETGSIKEALIAGLGGILSFLSFGLFDKDTVKNVADAVGGFVTKYIVGPVSNFINGLGDMFNTYIAQPVKQAFDSMMQWAQDLGDMLNDYLITPITTAIQPIKDFFSDMIGSVVNFLKNLEIPGISFKVPVYGDVAFGPWHPFSGSDAKSADNVSAQAPTSGSKVSAASKTNADEQAAVDAQSKTPASSNVNTAVQTNNSTTNVVKPSIRNQESSQQRYMSNRYA